MSSLRKWPHRLLLLSKWKVTPDQGPGFHNILTPGPDPNEKRRIRPESTPALGIHGHLWYILHAFETMETTKRALNQSKWHFHTTQTSLELSKIAPTTTKLKSITFQEASSTPKTTFYFDNHEGLLNVSAYGPVRSKARWDLFNRRPRCCPILSQYKYLQLLA